MADEDVDLATLQKASERARIAADLEQRPKAELLQLAADRGLDQVNGLNLGRMTKPELVRLLYGGTADEQLERVKQPPPVVESEGS